MSAAGALFGGTSARSQSKNLVEFRAGKMFMKGKMVHPDKRKGLVYVHQSDDSLMHFCWKERSKAMPESQDDLIIFPDDVEFKPVAQCTTGRVYVLKFKTSSRKIFFWMQEPKSDKDEEFCRKVNENLNNPPAPGSNRGGSSSGGGLGGLPPELAAGLGGGSDIQSLLGHMSQQELMQLLGGMGGVGGLSSLMGGRSSSQAESTPPSRVQSSPGPRTTTPQTTTTTPAAPRPVTAAVLPSQTTEGATGTATASSTKPPATSKADSKADGKADSKADSKAASTAAGGKNSASSSKIQLSDLQNILSGMGGEESNKEGVDLTKALTPESMIPILANAEIQERLLQYLPEGEKLPRTEGELRNTVSSPQFQQAMNSFSAALASGQLGPLMAQFNLGEDVANAAAQGDVEAFAQAMQSGLQSTKESSEDTEMKDDSESKN